MIQIYTGNGKGKTTAAMGLMIRAAGAGLSVYMAQFLKHGDYSELKTIKERFPEVRIRQYGMKTPPHFPLTSEDAKAAGDGIRQLLAELRETPADLIILDEFNIVLSSGLIEKKQGEKLIEELASESELVITGRDAPEWLINRAGLVTEMKEIKHYYRSGQSARKGIEY